VGGPIATRRLVLEPLRVEHARELVAVLADPALYAFTGGRPPSEEELAARYARQLAGDPGWLNWIVRYDGIAAGYLQATRQGDEAELAWVIGTAHQGAGLAAEAGLAVQEWLREQGVRRFTAHIGPDHRASAGVARRLGMAPTDVVEDGEVRWTSGDSSARRLDS
jgi:RimJ/RimL family protein N-acetyltransferase